MSGDKINPGMTGVSTLFNNQHVDPNIDVSKEEAKIINNCSASALSIQKEEMDEINAITNELGFSLDGLPDKEPTFVGAAKDTLADLDSNLNSERASPAPAPVPMQTMSTMSIAPRQSAPSVHSQSMTMPAQYIPNHQPRPFVTDDQKKKDVVNKVLENIRGNSQNLFSTQHEQDKDTKAHKIDQILSLMDALKEEGINIDGIAVPGMNDSLDEIDSVLNLLNMKNNRYKYANLAEEVLSGCAELIEGYFDGNRVIPFTTCRPDYTGYANNVSAKVHRLRLETSQIVGGVIENNNISPFGRILTELLPGFLLYPKIKQKQKTSKPAVKLSTQNIHNSFNTIRGHTEVDQMQAMKNL